MLSRIWLLQPLWTVICHVPLSMGFARQEHWSGLPIPPQEDLPDPRLEPAFPASPVLAGGFFITESPAKLSIYLYVTSNLLYQILSTHLYMSITYPYWKNLTQIHLFCKSSMIFLTSFMSLFSFPTVFYIYVSCITFSILPCIMIIFSAIYSIVKIALLVAFSVSWNLGYFHCLLCNPGYNT